MCTRLLWSSEGVPGRGHVLVARGMDWYEDARTVLAVRPRGTERESRPGDPASFTWTSKYGSVVALMYGKLVADGMNEAGLQSSGLYLAESDYGERDPERPPIDLYIVIQYMLDNFATVADALGWLKESRVQIVPLDIGGRPGSGHISLADSSGDSAIIEYLDGELSLHHGPEYSVMTNSPPYDEQLELERHYTGLGGDAPLPGGHDSRDRFARTAFYSAQLPATDDLRLATAQVFSVLRNAGIPYGIGNIAVPNGATTRWRTVSDLTNRRYYYESTMSPNVVWVEFDKVSFEPGPELLLDAEAPDIAGEQSTAFTAA
ncbi:MAG: linear amide C-N hydrolase [Microbacterium sp.]